MSAPAAMSWGALRAVVEERLAGAVGEQAAAEARWIVLEASGLADHELLVDADAPVPALAHRRVDMMVERRVGGEPLQYVLGSWSFRGLDLMVDRRVLIPRPETEVVAEVALDELVRRGARVGRHDPWSAGVTEFAVADLGTGSGALALALVSELPDAAVWASDADPDALAVARANLSSIGSAATRVRLLESDWFDAFPDVLRGGFRLIVSNPPYVSSEEHADLPPDVAAYEPYRALVSGPTGLEALHHLVAHAREWLEPGGALVLELAPHQAATMCDAAAHEGYVDTEIRVDLSGRPRVLVARAPD